MNDLDDAITRAMPRDPSAPELDAAVAELVRRARPSTPSRRWAVRLGIGAVGLGVLAGGAAAASTAIDWVPWLAEPDLSFEFTTPDGLECFGRAAVDEEREWTAEQIAGLEAVIRDRSVFEDAVASAQIPVDPARHPDDLYVEGVAMAYSDAVRLELTARGAEEIDWGFQIQCPGAQW